MLPIHIIFYSPSSDNESFLDTKLPFIPSTGEVICTADLEGIHPCFEESVVFRVTTNLRDNEEDYAVLIECMPLEEYKNKNHKRKMEALEFIDLVYPEHDRTSCSDEDINNGFRSRTGASWHGRCTRCMYLEIIKNGTVPEGFVPGECNG